ncbi:MAG: 2-C-methyl-D-erythritol 4-phosphate cytidylyltransferase [Proteobacteria bacterium]|nr:2-C-methyl-D-erythritol 4-phosphate cytidylyltransferase [Pseudomonadota bacterium]MBU1584604.1 2-C-methyl-D-erythritol 4-phosphate cytidylyltransferase [Pseudomonadota bacterium]MBU2453024.1 2-C-methyl-D-erythritol 4-phosphate cytidylyltransferase [Pseudomonadota bacterium]MBU2630351.1 2-C-methyl-D-erythritol 4-phosphate cytidylyltransferase [Pseudomonadota bacterium]
MVHLKIFAIIVAAGKGLRMGSKIKKQYLCLGRIPILARTIMQFDKCDQVDEIVLVIPEQDREYCQKQVVDPYGFGKKIHLVDGGKERQQSVLNGLKWVGDTIKLEKQTIVMIHDGVRPFVDQTVIEACIQNAIEYGACVPAVKITDTVKDVCKDLSVKKTVDRQSLYTVQTPQTFRFDLLLRAFDHAVKTSFLGTDDASLVEHLGHRVVIVNGSKLNIKITTQEDLDLGKVLLSET